MSDDWISVSDKLPERWVRVVLYDPTFDDHPVHVGQFAGKDNLGCYFDLIDNGGADGRDVGEVTHWMPFPDPPEAG